MTTTGPDFLEARALTKNFGGVRALDGASLSLRRGEIRGLIGANGAGKSTLVKTLAGEVQVDRGQILIDGRPVTMSDPRRAHRAGIVMVPQELTVAPNLTVAENVMLGAYPVGRLGRVRTRAMHDEAARALEFLAVDLPFDAPLARLSVVDQRLVMVARALAVRARLVMLDEPTAAMAPHEVGLILNAIRALTDRGITVLYVSHRLDEVVELCDHVTAMLEGRVAAELPREDVTHARLVELLTPEAAGTSNGHLPTSATPCKHPVGSMQGNETVRVDAVASWQLDGVSLVARGGEVLGLAGLLGSGARELLLAIAGLLPYDRGSIRCGEQVLRSGNPRRSASAGVAYLPGDRKSGVLPHHSIAANVTLPSLASIASGGIVRRHRELAVAEAWGRRVGLHQSMATPVAALSGGNQQKALVARWLAKGSAAMLLDDPTVGVDLTTREQLHMLVRAYVDQGRTVLVTSSDLDELATVSDRVLVFRNGAIVCELSADAGAQEILAAMTGGDSAVGVASAATG